MAGEGNVLESATAKLAQGTIDVEDAVADALVGHPARTRDEVRTAVVEWEERNAARRQRSAEDVRPSRLENRRTARTVQKDDCPSRASSRRIEKAGQSQAVGSLEANQLEA